MSQKIIAKSFRLNYFKNWESSSIVLKENYSDIFFFEYNIYIYLKKLCTNKQLLLNNIKIKKSTNSFRIYVSLYKIAKPFNGFSNVNQNQDQNDFILLKEKKQQMIQNLQNYCQIFQLNYRIQIFFFRPTLQQTLKKKYKHLRYKLGSQRNLPRYWRSLYSPIFVVIWTQSVLLLNNFLIKNLQKTKNHLYYLRNFIKLFSKIFNRFPNFIGYKIQWKGRLNGKQRARKVIFKEGIIPLNTIKYNIQYNFQEVITPSGVCGLKTWLLFNNNKNVITKKY